MGLASYRLDMLDRRYMSWLDEEVLAENTRLFMLSQKAGCIILNVIGTISANAFVFGM